MQRKKLIARSVHAEKKLVKSYLLILYRNEMGLRKNPSSNWYINEEDLSMNNNEEYWLVQETIYYCFPLRM